MSNINIDHVIKPVLRSRALKRRLKVPMLSHLNGSKSTFRRFYQSGGRDYEQYRLWLQSLSKAEQLLTPSNQTNEIKEEPVDMRTNVVSILPPLGPTPPLSLHSQQSSISITKPIHEHPLLDPNRHLSKAIKSQISLPLRPSSSLLSATTLTSSFDSQVRTRCDCSHLPLIPIYSLSASSLLHWSITDVGRFIEKHFPEKNIAQKFIQQKIDGRTLPLLTEDHLTRIFKMKLGPALHLLSLISSIQIQL